MVELVELDSRLDEACIGVLERVEECLAGRRSAGVEVAVLGLDNYVDVRVECDSDWLIPVELRRSLSGAVLFVAASTLAELTTAFFLVASLYVTGLPLFRSTTPPMSRQMM